MQIATSLLATAVLISQVPAESTPVDDGYAVIARAKVSLIDAVEVPAEQAGVLRSLELEGGTPITEGVEVKKDMRLGQLDDKDALARQRAAVLDHKVAQAEQSKSKVAITAAEKTAEVALAEHAESVALNRRVPKSITAQQIRRQKLTHERAKAEAAVAESDSKTAALTVELRGAQLEVAGLNLDRHEIKSPLEGMVVRVLKHVGEWVNPGDPILQIVGLDRLRVDGFLNLSEYDRAAVVGQPVVVQIQLQDGRQLEEFQGAITFVSPLIDSSREYRVRCEVKNRRLNGEWVMLPGMEARMKIQLKKLQLAGLR